MAAVVMMMKFMIHVFVGGLDDKWQLVKIVKLVDRRCL